MTSNTTCADGSTGYSCAFYGSPYTTTPGAPWYLFDGKGDEDDNSFLLLYNSGGFEYTFNKVCKVSSIYLVESPIQLTSRTIVISASTDGNTFDEVQRFTLDASSNKNTLKLDNAINAKIIRVIANPYNLDVGGTKYSKFFECQIYGR